MSVHALHNSTGFNLGGRVGSGYVRVGSGTELGQATYLLELDQATY